MAKRRGRGEGSISQRSDGRWQARVDLGRGEDGRRRRKTVYGATRQAVSKELNALLGRTSTNELLTASTPTLKAWLEDWFKTHRDEWRAGTQRVYRVAIDAWLVPQLGTVSLERLKPATIQRWINQQTKDGARQKVVMAHGVLRSALAWAMTQRVITYNAATLAKVPRPARKKIAPLSAAQAQALIDAASSQPLGGMVIVPLTMGLRLGEVSGLTWRDVELESQTLRVRQQIQAGKGGVSLVPLKTTNSRRTLVFPAVAVAALKQRRVVQLEERLRAGSRWDNADDLVFTMPDGQPVQPVYTRRVVLASLLKAAGLGAMRFHGLRHTAATLLLTNGTPLFDVSRVLGHAQIAITSDIYGHLVPEMAANAAARMDAVLKPAKA